MTDSVNPPPQAALQDHALANLIAALRPAPGAKSIMVGDMMSRIGRSSFAATLFVIGLLMVSPLSGIPLVPGAFALVVILVCIQAIIGRNSLWLPGFLTRRTIPAAKMHRALDQLDKPARWVDRHSKGRVRLLARRPLSSIAYLVILAIAVTWPPLALIPFSTTILAVGLALIAAGLVTLDGFYIVAGYVWTGVIYTGAIIVLLGLV